MESPELTVALIIVLGVLVVALIAFSLTFHNFIRRLEMLNIQSRFQIARMEATIDRMESATKVVAKNLKDSVDRADATDGPDGAAADAALRTGDTPQAIRERQNEH